MRKDDLIHTALRVTVPETEMTKDRKYKCPLDQEVYGNKEDFEAHCKDKNTSYYKK